MLFQLSRNKVIGLSKILKELLEFKQYSKDEGGKLYEKISKMIESSSSLLPEEVLKENIKKYRNIKQEELIMEDESTVIGMLRKKYFGVSKPSI